jgi:hypothetical protein
MSGTKTWNVHVPKAGMSMCQKKVMARLRQAEDDETPTIVAVPYGFNAATRRNGGIHFHCKSCKLAVLP